MEKKNQVPKYPPLRFPEFTDEWKKVKLGEVLKFFSTNTLSWEQLDYAKEGIINIHYGLIHKALPTLTDVTSVCLPIVRNERDVKNSELCQDGDILIADASEDTDNVGKSIELIGCNSREVVAGLHTLHGRSQEDFAIGFKGYLLASPGMKKQLQKIAQGVKVYSINPRLISPINLWYPSLPEQRKIAALLSLIDERIEVQNAIIKEQEALKAALLRRLFDRTLRFPEFTDEWKKVKLGEVTCERNETNAPTLPLLSITADKGIIPQIDSEKKDTSNTDKSKYKRICPGDIGYNTMRMWQGRSALSFVEGIVSPAYTIVTPLEGLSPLFLSYLIKRPRLIYEFWTHSQGLVEDTLNCKYKDLSQIAIFLPSLPEQKKIAALLSAIDERIAVETEYAALLQKQKAYLLRQMFV